MIRIRKIEARTKFNIGVLTAFAVLILLAAGASAQTCTLRTQGYTGGCSNVNVLWFTQTGQSGIARFDLNTFAGQFTAPNTARSFSIPTSCSSGGQVVITEVRTNGTTCTAQYSGNLPHNRPCDQCSGVGGGNGASIVSAANFRGGVARNSIVSAFPDPNTTFTDQTQYAFSLPLPTTLAGVTVEIGGQLCPLTAVTPGQINFLLPEWLADGPTEVAATIRTTRGSVGQFFGRPQLNPNAPGVFTLSSTGAGPAASNWLVIKPNGQQVYYAPGTLRFDPGDVIVLILYGTGINDNQCDLILNNGQTHRAKYCGASWMPGVQQMNFLLDPAQVWTGQVSGFVRVHRAGVGWWDSQGFDLRR